MVRKVFFVFIIIFCVAILVYSYLHFKKIQQPVSDAFNAIPEDAAFIIESKQWHQTWTVLSETNMIWKDIITTESFNQVNTNLKFIDSLFINNNRVKEMLQNQSILVSAHISGASSYNFLFTFNVSPLHTNKDIEQLIIDVSSAKVNFLKKEYDEVTINSFQLSSSKKSFFYALSDGVFIGSYSAILIEDAIRHLHSGKSIVNNKYFQAVHNTSGFKTDANVYVNHATLPNVVATYLLPDYDNDISFLTQLANWTELDLKIKPNAFMLNGFTYSDDSVNNYFNLFLKQKPQEIELVKVIPSKTAFLICLGISQFDVFYNDFLLLLDKSNKRYEYDNAIKIINQQYNCDIQKNMLSWIGTEMGMVITEIKDVNAEHAYNKYIIVKANDIENAKNQLNELILSTSEQDSMEMYDMYAINKIPVSNIWGKLLGSAFTGIEENYFTVIDNYIIFGNSTEAIKGFINSYIDEKTLFKDVHFNTFSNNLSSDANLFIYSNIARSAKFYQQFFNNEYAQNIQKNADLVKKFEAISIQISSVKDNLLYNTIYLKHNPISKQETNSLWEIRLDTAIYSKPFFVINHNTQAKEIFVQDENNKIYLLSNTGKILWTKQLTEKIKSDVFQIEVFKNKKLQMLFNTASKIYLLDRNGNTVEGFPITLKAKATNGLSVFDYDKNKVYRILVACDNKKIYNYNQQGKEVSGWEFDKTEDIVLLAAQHFVIQTKDYVVFVDSKGQIYTIDRKGSERISIKEKLPISKNNTFYIEKGKDINRTALISTDSTGKIIYLYFNGEKEEININEFSSDHYFSVYDVNNDKDNEFIFVDDKELTVFNEDKTVVFGYTFDNTISEDPLFYKLSDDNKEIGVVSASSNEVFLISSTGTLHSGFPLFGSTSFDVIDLNTDGTMDLVVGNRNGILYTYIVE